MYRKTKAKFTKTIKIKITKYNAIMDDFCFHNFAEKFDFIIGQSTLCPHTKPKRQKISITKKLYYRIKWLN